MEWCVWVVRCGDVEERFWGIGKEDGGWGLAEQVVCK